MNTKFFIILSLSFCTQNTFTEFKDYHCGPSIKLEECKKCCAKMYPGEEHDCEKYCFEGIIK